MYYIENKIGRDKTDKDLYNICLLYTSKEQLDKASAEDAKAKLEAEGAKVTPLVAYPTI